MAAATLTNNPAIQAKSKKGEVGLDKVGLARWGLTRWCLTSWAWRGGAWQGVPGLVLAINLITGPSPSCSRISSLQKRASSLAFLTFNKAHVEKEKIAELSTFTFSTRSLPTCSRDFSHSLQSRQQYLSAPVNNMNCPLGGSFSGKEIDFEITWIFPRLNCRSSSPSELSWDKVIISILLREDWSVHC